MRGSCRWPSALGLPWKRAPYTTAIATNSICRANSHIGSPCPCAGQSSWEPCRGSGQAPEDSSTDGDTAGGRGPHRTREMPTGGE